MKLLSGGKEQIKDIQYIRQSSTWVCVHGRGIKISIKQGKRAMSRDAVCVFLPLLTGQGHYQQRGGDIFSITASLLQ